MNFGGKPLTRLQPKMSAGSYKTFKVSSPLTTHYRKATCAEVDCDAWREGWTLPLASMDERMQYLARHSGRSYREVDGTAVGLGEGRYLVFPAGQECFRADTHRVSLERQALYFVGRGDFRATGVAGSQQEQSWMRGAQRIKRPEDFVEVCHEHLSNINREIEKGA